VCTGRSDTAASAGPSDSRGSSPNPGPARRSAAATAPMTANGRTLSRTCAPGRLARRMPAAAGVPGSRDSCKRAAISAARVPPRSSGPGSSCPPRRGRQPSAVGAGPGWQTSSLQLLLQIATVTRGIVVQVDKWRAWPSDWCTSISAAFAGGRWLRDSSIWGGAGPRAGP
jgi:hypothetical protein